MRQRGELFSDLDQPRGIGLGVAVELQLEIARAGVFFGVGDTALAFDPVVKADGVPDGDALEATARSEEPRDIVVGKIGRQLRVDAGDIFRHALEEIGAGRAQQRIEDGLVDLRRPEDSGKRRNVFLRASLDVRRDTCRVQAERGLKTLMGEIELARD